jgi:ATP-binding cassette, subfamily B, bacterial
LLEHGSRNDKMSNFPFYRQLDAMDCGPTCLHMVAKYHGVSHSVQSLRQRSEIGRDGVSMLGIAQAAEQVGFRTLAVKVSFQKMATDVPLPSIVHWQQNHFVVVYKVSKKQVYVADPAKGLLVFSIREFESAWATTVEDGEKVGIELLLEPTPRLSPLAPDGGTNDTKRLGFTFLFGYLWRYKRLLVQHWIRTFGGKRAAIGIAFPHAVGGRYGYSNPQHSLYLFGIGSAIDAFCGAYVRGLYQGLDINAH